MSGYRSRDPLLTSDDLTQEPRAWQPTNDVEAVGARLTVRKVENWDGVLMYYAVEEWD